MSDVREREVSGTSDSTAGFQQKLKRNMGVPLILQLAAMVGIGALLYPSASDWVSTLGHNAQVSGYIEAVERLPDADLEAMRNTAQAYNSLLPQGVLRDPYSATSDEEVQDAAYQHYEEILRISDSDVIGEVAYPSLGISLPLHYGTQDEAISKGAGHLYGSSLPVGGPSTHSVLTAHSGLIEASLFTELPKAQLGEIFTLNVLGETQFYRVDRIETVLPEQTESLGIVEGREFVTLFTCTPIGINSHRLLVRGERIDAPKGAESLTLAGDGRTAGFPWWAIGFVGGSAAVAFLLFAPPRSSRKRTGAKAGNHRADSDGGEDV